MLWMRGQQMRSLYNIYFYMLPHFSNTCEFWSSKANWHLLFSLPSESVIVTDLLGNRTLLKRVKRVKGLWFVSWWISIRLGCFCVWRFVACDCNYDWQQWRTPLWSRLLNFTACVFLKNAVTVSLDVSIWEWHWQPLDWITHQTNDVNDVCLIIIVQHSPSFM